MNKISANETTHTQRRAGAARSAPQEKFNRDINPHAGLAAVYSALESLIVNAPVSQAFAAHERAAIWKRAYTVLGRAALVCILLVMIFFDYSVTLGRLYPSIEIVRVVIALIAGLGLLCQQRVNSGHRGDGAA